MQFEEINKVMTDTLLVILYFSILSKVFTVKYDQYQTLINLSR